MKIVNEVVLRGMIERKHPELYSHCVREYSRHVLSFFSVMDYMLWFIEYPNNTVITEPKDIMTFISINYHEISLKLL